MAKISFQNQTTTKMTEFQKLAKQLINSAIKILNLEKENLCLSIVFVDDKQALKINQEYRHKNYIPDVISFPIMMSEQEIEALGFREIGDLFICLSEAQRKTLKYHHTIKEEMAFLFVHGFLHLLSYDHETNKKDEAIMFGLQDQILQANQINYEIKFVEADYQGEENEF
ncbi:rRNA maturation RNase YbeY [Williamsoniiplasma lucivorax]|uniref:Endoribonuclease YbeY n=1 Tax=Williamsoniiplasma lucivorax TaxID=209274 RepID=A0A2S5RCY6_9MOLU|nr:rRNA maturation RNase YbeY [Williamsoniiplasma lucivorax]PPE05201.1 16S rRNA maturation RNase YbeY [Williamsoniiplasma lucivorax]